MPLPNRLPSLLLLLLLALLGLAAFVQMPRDIDPLLPDRTAQVVAIAPGVGPEILEEKVMLPIERALADLPGIESIGCTSGHGTVVVRLSFEPGRDPQPLLASVRERIERVRGQLVTQIPFLSGPWLESTETVGLFDTLLLATNASPTDEAELGLRVRAIADRLRAEPAVTQCRVLGEPLSAVHVTYEDEDLADAGLTPQMLAERLRAYLATLPGGYVEDDKAGRVLPVVFEQELDGLEALRNLPVRDPRDGSVSPLGDICKIEHAPVSPSLGGITAMGKPALGIAVKRRAKSSSEDYTAAIDRAIARGGGEALELVRGLDRPAETQRLTDGTTRLVLLSIALVIGLVVLALGLRIGVAVAFAILLTLGISFLLLQALGFEWNVVTLAALSVAVGLLVDNHVVLGHHARRVAAEGETDLAGRCLRDLGWPLLISMLTTAVAFLPAWFLRDGPGEYVSALAPVVGVCLVVSLVVGFLLTPMLSASPGARARAGTGCCAKGYAEVLEKLRRVPALGVILLALCGAAALFLAKGLDRGALPALDSSERIVARVSLPPGSSQTRVAEASSALASILGTAADGPAVTFLGADPPAVFRGMHHRLPRPSQATLLARPAVSEDLARVRDRELGEWAERFPAARLEIEDLGLTPRLLHPVALRLTAPDREGLEAVVTKALGTVAELGAPGTETVTAFSIAPDLETLAEEAFLPLDLASAAATASTGLPVTSIALEGKSSVPVVLRQETDPRPMVAVEEAYVHKEKGRPTFLEDLAKIRETPVRVSLERWNGRPSVTLVGSGDARVEGAALEAIRGALPGVEIEAIGTSAKAREPVERVLGMLPLVAVAILLLLIFQTGSGIATASVCLNALPAVLGSVLALLIVGQPFGIMALLGMITVGGILVNNAVLMLDRLRGRKAFTEEEIAEVASSRVLPIVVTALCAVLGVLPLAFSGSPLWAPFAVSLIGGVLGATVSTLIWIPVSWRGRVE